VVATQTEPARPSGVRIEGCPPPPLFLERRSNGGSIGIEDSHGSRQVNDRIGSGLLGNHRDRDRLGLGGRHPTLVLHAQRVGLQDGTLRVDARTRVHLLTADRAAQPGRGQFVQDAIRLWIHRGYLAFCMRSTRGVSPVGQPVRLILIGESEGVHRLRTRDAASAVALSWNERSRLAMP